MPVPWLFFYDFGDALPPVLVADHKEVDAVVKLGEVEGLGGLGLQHQLSYDVEKLRFFKLFCIEMQNACRGVGVYCQGTLTEGHTWVESGTTDRAAVEKRMSVVKEFMPSVYPWVEKNIENAIAKGWLKP